MAGAPAAVIVERASKHYGRQDKPDYKPVLINLNMTVEKGIIYGLLGPSGCGKTTLLSCIVGRRKLDSGDVWVLGGRPGEKGSGVPGPRVGYMPQDIALVGEFTVRDAIYYFGRIYGMSTQKLTERFDQLSNLLELPGGGRFVKKLSGGQQRRVSLAAALVHDPELLILDEPTVGLDPVLRERIWEYLSELARGGTTVIITTHYIDETKQAHKIGLLRDGQLLAEDSPEEMLSKWDCDTLEEAFLKLAMRQHQLQPLSRSTLSGSPDVIPESRMPPVDSRYPSSEDFNVVNSSTDVLTKKEKPPKDSNNSRIRSKARYKAVFIKSIQQFSRHPGGLIFSILFPIIEMVAFFMAVGHDPRELKIAVVNEETAFSPYGLDICSNKSLEVAKLIDQDTCRHYMLSCWFLDELEKHDIYQVPYNTTHDAKDAVIRGQLYGALHFNHNFSDDLSTRIREGHVEDDIVEGSTIAVWLDMTNHQISHYLKSQIHKTYASFTKRVMRACKRNENLVQIPVHFAEPVYGESNGQMVHYMAPGIMITVIFFLPAIVTSNLLIADRLEGVWERSAVAGVKAKEMLHVHIFIHTIVIFVQTLEVVALSYGGYALPSRGSLFTCGLLLFLQGLSGMCYGFLLSIYCESYTLSFFVATGSFYPMILLCGILWPLEAMSDALRYIALSLPFTVPSMSLRDIMEKGYGITHPSVYYGFIITMAWIAVTLGLCMLRLKYKKT